MTTRPAIPTLLRKHRNVILTVGMLLLWASCTRVVRQDEWDKQRGPVIPHDTFPADCSLCHVGNDWNTLKEDFVFDHEKQTGVALKGAHAKAQCLRCHNDRGPVAKFAAKGCVGCHVDKHGGKLGINCNTCHDEQSWRPTNAIAEHNRTRFPLIGTHAATQCIKCHTGADSGNFSGLDISCVGCHMSDYQSAKNPDHVAGGFDTDCKRCHTPISWQGASIDHPSSFPLSAGHAGLNCNQCHTGNTFQGLSTDCVACHLSDYQSTTNPNHAASGFSTNCTQCHSTSAWLGAKFNHPSSFPLSAGHAGLKCADCHVGGKFQGLSTDCVACHLTDFQATKDPNHVASGFATNCTQCHTTNSWQGAKFDHPASFPLTAGHAGVKCTDCHVGGKYDGLSNSCASCHTSDYQKTKNPSHAAAGFGTDCAQCHTTSAWLGAKFTHTNSFPLTGGHSGQSCNACHTGNNFKGQSSECVSCHLADFQSTQKPNHTASGFGTDCKQCHETNQWKGAQFTHTNNFPLTGSHAGLNCTQCHVGGNFKGLSTDCVSCHLADYQSTKDPNHAAAGFATDCKKCHNTNAWQGAAFTHTNTFPLAAGHAGLKCTDCHVGGKYQGLSSDCVSCHLTDFQGTKDPNHVASGFATDCRQCHTTTTWQGAKFEHPAAFPLAAGHAGLKCSDCHVGGNFKGLSSDCVTCHLTHYQATKNPNHAAAGFATDCKQCHTTTTWTGAKFNHPASFPLSAGHGGLNCTQCHVGGKYQGLSSDCVTCHLTKYQATKDPNHAAAGFPTDCKQCHTTTTWLGAKFDHPASFPLSAGHGGLNCTDCHVGGKFQGLSTDCVTCHLTDYQGTTNPNHAASGFSTTCTTCHTNMNTWKGAVFNHTFPITSGAHKVFKCSDCHLNPANQQTFSCTHCHDHSQTTMNNKHREVRNYVWSSPACLNCHPNGRH
ncbi:MAG: hypothetical protein GC164_04650 [Phycisphaera sp.]|nr:hypothetical protein [Phycisphaera sp.]